MIAFAEAPSNIALIKYMGKVSGDTNNIPSNGSISWTLNHLRTRVEAHESGLDHWMPLKKDGWQEIALSEKGQKRFVNHWKFLKTKLGIKKNYKLLSANNFPSDCGLASSASSFAALTTLAYNVALIENNQLDISKDELADLSRQGSGSSCRSFYNNWGLWEGHRTEEFETPYKNLLHQVIIVDNGVKKVSSSEAHQKVQTSELFKGRTERAQKRLSQLKEALKIQDWQKCYEISLIEFWDMHALFETSEPPFHYMTADSLRVIRFVQEIWDNEKDGPIITMDAGANVHLLYRADQKGLAKMINATLGQMFPILGEGGE